MYDLSNDAVLMRRQRQLLHDVEQSIRESNREIIHGQIPELNRDRFVRLAMVVAQLRAAYLQTALQLSDGVVEPSRSPEWVAELRERRQAFEEAREAFDALQRAIERGYVDIGEPGRL